MIGTELDFSGVGEPCPGRLERMTGEPGTEREPWLVDCALNEGHGRIHETAAGHKFGSGVTVARQ